MDSGSCDVQRSACPSRASNAPPPPLTLRPLQEAVRTQIDYYFSVGNLVRDVFLRSKMNGEVGAARLTACCCCCGAAWTLPAGCCPMGAAWPPAFVLVPRFGKCCMFVAIVGVLTLLPPLSTAPCRAGSRCT